MSVTKAETSGAASEEFVDSLQNADTYIHGEPAVALSPEHREYLLHRYGTLDLDPIPGPGGADPYNWPAWKVCQHSIFPIAVL